MPAAPPPAQRMQHAHAAALRRLECAAGGGTTDARLLACVW
eukprot:COSAG02_NODE_41959_length_389_cov_0.737931_1_plen_40_part_10